MSRESVITKLQQAVYILNLAAVCLVAGIMTYSMLRIVDVMKAEQFLRLIEKRPWRPESILITAVACYLCLVFFSCVGQLWNQNSRYARNLILLIEVLFCVGSTVAMNMNYNGLVLLVVADMVRGQKGSRQKIVLGIAIIGLYTILDYNLAGNYLEMIPIDSFIFYFSTGVQAVIRGIISIFRSVNLVLFILYLTMLIQGEHRERERIQTLYEQLGEVNHKLQEANQKLKEFAVEAEKNAETRERNRLAREIHDTLGHALTGIVAGIDASLLMIDVSTDATKKQLQKIGDVARQGMTDVRRSVSKLRPDALEKFDLENALTRMLEDIGATSGTQIVFQNQVDPFRFREDEEEVIYRVIQEATTNSVRHGHASKIWITVTKENQWLTIAVKDNGCGCKDIKEGFGLKHMEERLKLLNGSLEYEGREGFLILARIPIRWGEEF
ncbi:MAG: sensor histidine kinase [bacterium]|nr:sensor histidine kinase [bacterium]